MTYTFLQPFNNISRVRFQLGDINENRVIYSDEVIAAVITEAGTWQAATIQLIMTIIAQLSSQPDFHADWLTVDYKTALEYWNNLLTLKARELNVPLGQLTATASYLWRPDSNQQSSPTYPKNIT